MDESEWHVTEYYDNIRHKLKNLDDDAGLCPGIDDRLPKRVCKTAMQVSKLVSS